MRFPILLALCALAACSRQPSEQTPAANDTANAVAPVETPSPPPSPSPSPTVDNRSTARYRCMDGSRLVARFDPDNGRVAVSRGGRRLATLRRQRAASGIHYTGGGYDLRAGGDDMTFTAPNLPPIPCTVIR